MENENRPPPVSDQAEQSGAGTLRYMRQLDGIRCFAVLFVLIQHFVPYGYHAGILWGKLGVRIFFVLSGFLITSILLDCKSELSAVQQPSRLHSLRRFYIRRFLRIFPLFYGTIFVMALSGDEIFRRTFFYNVTYLSNYYRAITGEVPGYTAHFWSLAVEEQFYLIWPWLILFVPLRRLPHLIVTFILLGPAWRIAGVLLGWDPSLTLHATPACMDTLGAGALLALLTKHPAAGAFRSGQWRPKIFLLGIVGFAWYCSLIGTSHVAPLQVIFGDTAIALFCFWMIDAASRGEGRLGRAVLEIRPVVYLGKISYGIYVLHLFVPNYGRAAMARLGLPPIENEFVAGFVWAVLTVSLAALSWKFFEGPINRLKRHFPYKDKVPDAVSPDAVSSMPAS